MVERYDIERYYEQSPPIVRALERMRIRALVALARPAPGDRVLEVGCGAGHVLERFAGCERVGVDLSARMLGRTRRRLGNAVHLARASADALPFPAGAFPIVVCTEVLEHVPDPRAALSELLRVAGPWGRVILSIPNEDLIDRVKRIVRRVPGLRRLLRTLADEGNEWHLHRMSRGFLERLVEDQGRVERLRAVPSRFLPLRYAARVRANGPAAEATHGP